MTTTTTTTRTLEHDHLLATIESMQRAGHSERQIERAIARSLPRIPLRDRLRALAGRIAPRQTERPDCTETAVAA
jgi:hypothetical protein